MICIQNLRQKAIIFYIYDFIFVLIFLWFWVGREMKIIYPYCSHTQCADGVYTPYMCFVDCNSKGYVDGDCVKIDPKGPVRCCCYNR